MRLRVVYEYSFFTFPLAFAGGALSARLLRLFTPPSDAESVLESFQRNSFTGQGIWRLEGLDFRCIYFNRAAIASVGFDMTGKLMADALPGHREQIPGEELTFLEAYRRVLETGERREAEIYFPDLDAYFMQSMFALDEKTLAGEWINISRRVQLEKEVAERAERDLLTSCLNQRWFFDRLDSTKYSGLIMLDLDRFKPVNDEIGHAAGDDVLRQVSDRLRALINGKHHLVRYGGDEFIILDESGKSLPELIELAELALSKISEPYFLEYGAQVHLSASMGVADSRAGSLSAMFKAADAALRQVKNNLIGRKILPWSQDYLHQERRREQIDLYLNTTLQCGGDELRVVYQPIVRLSDNEIVGHEALLRWNNRVLGTVSPDEFIPRAEATGVINRVSHFVIHEALEEFSDRSQYVTINISQGELESRDLIQYLEGTAAALNFDLARLAVEVTERTIGQQPELYMSHLHRLKTLGVWVKLDDFGEGYSSLKHLLKLKPDTVKVDHGLIPAGPEDKDLIQVCTAIAGLRSEEAFTFTLVAEGIETEWQARFIKELGFEEGQGYYFGRPTEKPLEKIYKF